MPDSLAGFPVHLVGIKGTGMAALAEILSARGARITGSDTAEKFYTDALLQHLSIPYRECFAAENLPAEARLVVHSAAYRRDENPELIAAAARGIPILIYPEALGLLSRVSDSSGISGVHGKSTTTALCGAILKEWGFPATVLVGAEVPSFGGRSTLVQGERFLVAETCEYRRHFLNFRPARIVITSIEPDHLDYFRDLEDMISAFTSYGNSLPPHGALIYCHDDPGARTSAARIREQRSDLVMIPYGRSAEGPFKISGEEAGGGRTIFALAGWRDEFTLKIPGAHNVLNAAAALALCSLLWTAERGEKIRGVPRRGERMRGVPRPGEGRAMDAGAAARAIESFTGSRRRSEIVGEAGGILFMDDYAHHPTAIENTLAGIRSFYPERRLVVDFMSHTYSRTRALLPDFGKCFHAADSVILHRIYASAREQDDGGTTARDLYEEVSRSHPRVKYFPEPIDAAPFLLSELKPGDLFLTMGAGDNWKLGRELLSTIKGAR